jgi:p-cumate 2,3-dioxygenase beta subunit
MTAVSNTSTSGAVRVSRQEVEDFLYHEAELLDAWRLDEWLTLFTPDATYVVPGTDAADGDPSKALVLVDDDRERLYWRVERLKSRHAHREYPWSRTRRFITNVRITGETEDGITVRAAFLVYRFRNGHADPFIGEYAYTLVPVDGSFKIRARRAELDLEVLSPNGAVSMIL